LDEFSLAPVPDWAGGLRATWQPGTTGAQKQLARFLNHALKDYDTGRNRPDFVGTSRLSPHLHFGEISPRQIWHALKTHAGKSGWTTAAWRNSQYLAEIGWREFAHHLIYHFPHTPTECLRSEFADFRWRRDAQMLKAWQRGQTGYPFVDAGMRELWNTGWMHNRVRMVVASFLVKDLMIPWQEGAHWFWDTLVDADLAQNTLGWQWTAGCGADASPFFRVFNPVGQGERFDPQGVYVRRWVPELAALPDEWIHKPHQAPPEVLKRARIELGITYPQPIINHAIAREVALEAYARLKKAHGTTTR
jgi:deoxyribodipyrimidine photo-lyase